MDKKVINLLRELELKDIQITSQEQMLNRRNMEINELTLRLKNFNGGDSFDDLKRKLINLEVNLYLVIKNRLIKRSYLKII